MFEHKGEKKNSFMTTWYIMGSSAWNKKPIALLLVSLKFSSCSVRYQCNTLIKQQCDLVFPRSQGVLVRKCNSDTWVNTKCVNIVNYFQGFIQWTANITLCNMQYCILMRLRKWCAHVEMDVENDTPLVPLVFCKYETGATTKCFCTLVLYKLSIGRLAACCVQSYSQQGKNR